jgi:outer membrane biosynthesis protein TonB
MKMKKPAVAILHVIGLVLLVAFGFLEAQESTIISDSDINVTHFEDLAYPAIAGGASVQGVVVLRLRLDDRGSVVEAVPISGAPLLIRGTVDSAKKWRFRPNAQKLAVIVYNFRIEGVCHPGGWSSQMIFYPPNLAAVTACGRTTEP